MSRWFPELSLEMQSALWVMLIGAMTNVTCALLGCYLVLRRMSLLGDAIAHAVLPGLVVAFLFSGTLHLGWMFLGALVVGLLTSLLVQLLHRHGGVGEDAAMGVVFTSLFALGVVLIRRYGQHVDLDPDCVLNGLLELADLNRVEIAGYPVPRALVTVGPVLLAVLAFIVLFWKELLVVAFDPGLAVAMGFPARGLHLALMALVALAAVASFEQVGSILVVAMFIVPGAAAHLLCDQMRTMLVLAAAMGALSAVLGQRLAVWWNTNTAGTMAVVAGLFYLAALAFSPRYGRVVLTARNLAHTLRIVREDLLAMLYRLEELGIQRPLGPREAAQAVGGGLLATAALWSSLGRRELQRREGVLRLTDLGRTRAAQLVRSHRLWETYLVEHWGLPLDHVHEPAARMEHYLDQDLQHHVAAQLAQDAQDPHGRHIPRTSTPPS